MRLRRLRARNFRGIGDSVVDIPIDNDLVLIYAPNGYGKTSLTEAIEWLFYGETKRRKHGEQYWPTEYQNTYQNVHGGWPVHVEADVLLDDGRVRRLARIMEETASSEGGRTFVDGEEARFSCIGLTPGEASYPVVAQHALQTFIHTKPKDRRNAIAEALGLDDLISFQKTLDGARRSYTNALPGRVAQARHRLGEIAAELEETGTAANVAKNWKKGEAAPSDIDELAEAGRQVAETDAEDLDAILDALRQRRRAASKAVFDASKLALPQDTERRCTEIDEAHVGVIDSMHALGQAIEDIIAKAASTYAAAFLRFWQEGMRLADGSTTCPMCEEETLTPQQQRELQRRISSGQDAIRQDGYLRQAVREVNRKLETFESHAPELGPGALTTEEMGLLRSLFASRRQELEAFLSSYDQAQHAASELHRVIRETRASLNRLPEKLAGHGADYEAIREEHQQARSELQRHVPTYAAAIRHYSNAWAHFAHVLEGHVATHLEIRRIDAIGKGLRAEKETQLLAVSTQAIRSTGGLLQRVERAVQARQRERLDSRGAEVRNLYDMLNPGAEVGFEAMEPGTNKLNLHAQSFGRRMPAAPNLSQCQLNCLGLSVWLMRATTPTSPFGFIFLDDPVQSMDDNHYEAFLSRLVPYLLDHYGKQLIILSHFRNLVDRARSLNPDCDSRTYHVEQYGIHGPEFVEQSRLRKRLADIKTAAAGNETNRDWAMTQLRILVEYIVRDLHVKNCGEPAPASYDRANPHMLLKLFRQIPGTSPKEHDGLKDTVGFADPSHHTDQEYTTPTKERIRPHIDRLEQLMQTHGLL